MRRIAKAAALMILALSAAPAASQEQKINLLQKWEYWAAYLEAGGDKACFIVSQPTDSRPEIAGRGPVYFYVSFYPDEQTTREVSVRMGYAPDGKVTASIGNDTFQLLTKDKTGFVEKTAEAQKLVDAMKAGITMRIKGRTASGVNAEDTYSLTGVTDALKRIDTECNG